MGASMLEVIRGYLCCNCHSGVGFSQDQINELIENHGIKGTLYKKVVCKQCENLFFLYEGIIENLVKQRVWPDFICDIVIAGSEEVIVGKVTKVELPRTFLINKVSLTNGGGFAEVAPFYHGHFETNWFSIVSSELPNENPSIPSFKKIGDKHQVDWVAFGKSGEKYSETWIQLLAQIKEQMLHGQYNIATLTSEMMFESFLDSTLNKLLINKGISEESAYIIIESINSIYKKAHSLLKSLNGKGLQDEKPINKEWIKLMELRNKIAHGENVNVDLERAEWSLRTALEAIFYIYNNCEIYS